MASPYSITVVGVCFLTTIAAAVSVFADSTVSAVVVGMVSTNILALMAASKAGAAHEETLKLSNGKLSAAVRDALAPAPDSEGKGE